LSIENITHFSKRNATHGEGLPILDYSEPVFHGHLISKGLWLPRSPDLSTPDNSLMGCLKNIWRSNYPHTLEELQANYQKAGVVRSPNSYQVLHKHAVHGAQQ
jgi:hypothetical protein